MNDNELEQELARLRSAGNEVLADLVADLVVAPHAETLKRVRQLARDAYAAPPTLPSFSFSGRTMADTRLPGPFAAPMEAEGLKGAIFHGAAAVENTLRNAAFKIRLALGEKGPRLIAEGDSWFCFPLVEPIDVAARLAEHHLVYSLARPGDLFADYIKTEQLDKASEIISRYDAQALLLSGGGNEIIGENFGSHLDPLSGGFSQQSVEKTAKEISATINDLIIKIHDRHPHVKILAHGYDWPVPRDPSGWLRGPLEDADIAQEAWDGIVREIIDIFAAALDRVEARHPGVFFHADLRGSGKQQAVHWHDEIHLNSDAAGRAATSFSQQILGALGAS